MLKAFFKNFPKISISEKGQGLVEYAVILVLITLVVILLMIWVIIAFIVPWLIATFPGLAFSALAVA